jgi:nucleoside-diphosphate-sugar epimerase
MPAAIVTGASGFVGSHLADLLLERGWKLLLLARPGSRLRSASGAERLDVDFARLPRLPDVDAVFHVAGTIRAGTWEEYLEGNRDLARRVFEASRPRRFVHVSSLAVQGPRADCDETTPCAPISLYGRSKWEGEKEVWARRDRVPVTVVRPPVVYGPRDRGLLDLYRVVARGLRPLIGGPKRVSLVHVRDLCEGILKAAEAPEGANEVFYFSNPETRLMSEVLDLVARALGRRGLAVPLPDQVVRFLAGVAEDVAGCFGKRTMFNRDKALEMTQPSWCCSAAKAGRLLGWRPRVPLEAGMGEAIEAYRREGLLPGRKAPLT